MHSIVVAVITGIVDVDVACDGIGVIGVLVEVAMDGVIFIEVLSVTVVMGCVEVASEGMVFIDVVTAMDGIGVIGVVMSMNAHTPWVVPPVEDIVHTGGAVVILHLMG